MTWKNAASAARTERFGGFRQCWIEPRQAGQRGAHHIGQHDQHVADEEPQRRLAHIHPGERDQQRYTDHQAGTTSGASSNNSNAALPRQRER